MSSDPAFEHFAELSAQYFDPLCEALQLKDRTSEVGPGFAISSAVCDAVRVFFELERGLCHFSLGPAIETAPLCSVEVMARRFPRIRVLRAGEQRLSLHEQVQLIRTHWTELQNMFGPELPQTRSWMADVRAAEIAKYSGRG